LFSIALLTNIPHTVLLLMLNTGFYYAHILSMYICVVNIAYLCYFREYNWNRA